MSASDSIVVNARWQVSAEALDEVLALVREVRARSLAEPGCQEYEVFASLDDPCSLLLVERYRDAAAVEAHRATSHFQELVLGQIVPRLERRSVDVLQARG